MRGKIECGIAPAMQGFITPQDLLDSIASVTFWVPYKTLGNKEGKLFFIKSDDYILQAGISLKGLYCQRNEDIIFKDFSNISNDTKWVFCLVSWNVNTIRVGLFGKDFDFQDSPEDIIQKEFENRTTTRITSYTIPPNSILEFGRKRAIYPRKTYVSEEDFFETVVASFQSITEILDNTGSLSQFWDNVDEGRRPKRETESHAILHSLLYHTTKTKNYIISREPQVAGGNIEFLFTGILDTKEFTHVSVEVKNAHSTRLEQGLLLQLPKYMKESSSKYGLYLILYFKGDQFNDPDKTKDELEDELQRKAWEKSLMNIRILILDLTKRITPSRL